MSGLIDLETIPAREWMRWLDTISAEKPKTVNSIFTTLRACLNFCKNKFIIEHTDIERIKKQNVGSRPETSSRVPISVSVVVVADNIANTKELRKKLRHEVLVHHGLRAVVGDTEYGRILKTVYSGLGSKYLKGLISDVEQSYDKSDLNGFVEEVIAHAEEAERGKVNLMSLLNLQRSS
ncbi:hypothetical protein [Photobacterium nomapromontoriensis]|uniref:hypothetical protein n=1 Tax=Photobacterium nomapromontoriensis TaxID=2910237 RepID=UPI003D144FE1